VNTVFKTLIISFLANIFLVFIKFAIGIFINANVIIADALHSLSDILTDIVAIIGNKLSQKEEDIHHPKGHGKIQYLTSLFMGMIIILLSIMLIKEFIVSKSNTIPIKTVIIVIISIIIKYILYKYLYKMGKKNNNNILISSAIESKTDILSSICTLLVVVSSYLSKYIEILKYIDKVGALLISLFVLKTGYNIIKENISLMIGEVESNPSVINPIKKLINNNHEVKRIDDIILEKYGIYYDAIIKISMDENTTVKASYNLSERIKKQLLNSKFNIKYVSIHINPYKNN